MLKENGISSGIGGNVPTLPDPEKKLQSYKSLSKAIHSGLVRTAHDCSEENSRRCSRNVHRW